MDFAQIALELFIGFFALLIATKILGKTQITQITAFDFISAIILGELLGNAVLDEEVHIDKVVFAIAIWSALIYIIEIITQKFKGTRKLLEGEPSIVIRKGIIMRDVLKKNKLDINQLQHLLRNEGAFSIREVEYAVLETDGKVNVLKRANYTQPSIQDMNLPFPLVVLPVTLIIDGEVIWDNLEQIRKDEEWLKNQLAAFGISQYKEVMFAEWKDGEGFHVDRLA